MMVTLAEPVTVAQFSFSSRNQTVYSPGSVKLGCVAVYAPPSEVAKVAVTPSVATFSAMVCALPS